MQEPEIPADEEARLAELHSLGVLDTPPDPRFDRITELTRRLFQVPIVFISLVDANRQFFKSRQGCDATETSRQISFCGHAILQDDIFMVPDTWQDPRFVDNPLVTGDPFIRFYAGFPLSGPTGKHIGTLCIIDRVPRQIEVQQLLNLRDIGHWVETELQALLAEESARRLHCEFISTVSHELRTPLTSIRGSLGLLASGAVGEIPLKAQSLLNIAKNNCERLVLLINDILDIDKIESGNMRFDLVAQPLQPLISQAQTMTQAYAEQFRVQIALDCPPQAVWVKVDADRLLQVLFNLISNACKFSPPGSEVLLRLQVDNELARLAVIDRGPGIPEAFRSRIFQKFSQADSSDTRGKGGTGLGLNISQALIERMGGRIGFVSELGQGSEFFFELPCRPALPQAEVSGAPILICEDDPDIARLLCMMLEEGGWKSDIAHDAASARQMLQAGNYQAMTLDLTLPGEDGLTLLHWMRQQPAFADIAVVVVSATADHGKAGLSGGAVGVVDWLPKPIDARRLLATIQSVFVDRSEGANCILHVDDDSEFVEVIAQLLGTEFTLTGAANLQQAREKLAQQHFQLILLDLSLPDGNGAELLGNLPALNQFTPVMIFSAQDVDGHLLEKVSGTLVKSRVSENQLSAILHDFINRCNLGKTIGK